MIMIDRFRAVTAPLGTARYALVPIMILLSLPSLTGQVFQATDFNSRTSKTYGIQEAIDAAAAAGGGTVQIGSGTFVLDPPQGASAILIRPHVRLVGDGLEKTVLKLTSNSKRPISLIANVHFGNPDSAIPDEDIALEGFTVDANAPGQVIARTALQNNILGVGLEEAFFGSLPNFTSYSLLCIDPGPNQEIVTALQVTRNSIKGYFFRPHAAKAQVLLLVNQLFGIALIGVRDVTIQGLRIQNVPMDGIYISNTIEPRTHQYQTYSQQVLIQNTEFLRCHRTGVAVLDGSEIHILSNTFRFITGFPGTAVDVEPDRVLQHASNIEIRGNIVEDCHGGIQLALHNNGPTSENSWGQEVVGNVIRRVKVGCGILLYENRAAPTITSNEIYGAAWGGIVIVGTSGARITQNTVYVLRDCNRGIWVDDRSTLSVDNYISCNKIYLLDPVSGTSMPCSSGPSCGI